MAGNAYPHIVFAKNAEVLPQQTLADLLVGLFPDATVEQGEIKAELTLADGYTTTFWYDDDADGLGERYADYAAPLRRKRVTRCTTMIDASGAEDADGTHARDVARIMAALADRDGVYVFSETTKRFVGMDYEDDLTATAPPTDPAADLRSEASYPAHAEGEVREVVLQSEEASGEYRHTEVHPVDRPTETPIAPPTETDAPATLSPEPAPAVEQPARPEPIEPQRVETTPVESVVESAPAPATDTSVTTEPHAPAATTPGTVTPSQDSPAAAGTPVEPARTPVEPAHTPAETPQPEKKGFFKKLFGRKG